MTESTTNPMRYTFWHYINPVCLAVGVIGLALHFEVEMLDIGMWGMGLWGVTGLLARQKDGLLE